MTNEGPSIPVTESNVPQVEKAPVVKGAEYNPDLYLKGNYYIELKNILGQYGPFKTQAYIYGRGVVDIEKREDDPSRIFVVTDARRSHEMNIDDEMYLSTASLRTIQNSSAEGMTPEEKNLLNAQLEARLVKRDIKALHPDVAEITDEQKAEAAAALAAFKEEEGISKPPNAEIEGGSEEEPSAEQPKQDIAA